MTKNRILDLSEADFVDYIREGRTLIDFYANWCKPCIAMEPVLHALSEKYPEIKFGKVNVDNNPDVTNAYRVSSLPNFILFKEGVPIEQIVGARSFNRLEERLLEFLE